jgi:hypothetical protein
MTTSLYFNRKHNFRIFGSNRGRSPTRRHQSRSRDHSTSGLSPDSFDSDSYTSDTSLGDPFSSGLNHPAKKRNCCGMIVRTPNSSRFAENWHSRVLQKWPFLIEMFYWVLNLLFYSLTKALAQVLFSANDGLRELAQDHGILVLDIEHRWPITSLFFPIKESDFQAWFLTNHLSVMTFLNRIYSLVHIPGTVA